MITLADHVFLNYEPYRSMPENEMEQRLQGAVSTNHLQHWQYWDGKSIVFTWLRPGRERNVLMCIDGACPDAEFWSDHDPNARLWIVDMAASPGVSGVAVGRFLSRALVVTGIAKSGETVLFRRNGGATPGRFGKAIVRG